MDNTNWEEIAREILEKEKLLKSCNYPAPISILVKWKNNTYIGSIQKIVPEFSKEIVLLSKSTYKLPYELVSAIRKLDNDRLELYADDSLDLDGRQHVLRIVENRLVLMDHQQTEYIMRNLPNICEI